MKDSDIKILEDNGWMVECESPFEISQNDGSFASNYAAKLILETLKQSNSDPVKKLCDTLSDTLADYQLDYDKTIKCIIEIKDERLDTKINLSFNGERFEEESSPIRNKKKSP
jgi:glycerophosphoryl diester phosphodiesterase